jgi:spore coat protein CotH
MSQKIKFTILIQFLFFCASLAQSIPDQWRIDHNQHMVIAGDQAVKKFYNESKIEEVRLYFKEANFLNLLSGNYASKTELMCRMVYDGQTYDSIGVRYKGATSYFMNQTQKKSFSISMDAFKDGQDVQGVRSLNLNNSWDDPSMMREVLYYNLIRNHTPAAKANFVILYLNDVSWGIYQNVQQLNKDFLKEWYPNADGTNLRADTPVSGPPGGGGGGQGPNWGDGTAAINYLGTDTALYQKYYTFKSSKESDPWQNLIDASQILKNSTNLEVDAPKVFDIDKILWHLACEIAFGDDDSYVFKGKMDYYLYHEPTQHRWSTYDYDANSTFVPSHSTWSPFYNETKANYPLLNKLLAVPSFRQRYLAHLRTIIDQSFDPDIVFPLIDTIDSRIRPHVLADTKKASSNQEYTSELAVLKKFVTDRRTYLLNNAEVKQESPTIRDVQMKVGNDLWPIVREGDKTLVTAKVNHTIGIKECALHIAGGIVDRYERRVMYDDGSNGDLVASDDIYSLILDNPSAGKMVAFYVEAVASNAKNSVTFFPRGTEHQMLTYQVQAPSLSAPTVVINEFMASNMGIIKDEFEENEDWIELYNTTDASIDLGGYVLTDSDANLDKFVFAEGTIIPSKGYIIVWADEDGVQGPLHANFRLAIAGERIILLNKSKVELDRVEFGAQQADLSSARQPNGTGSFAIGPHTFGKNNSSSRTADFTTKNVVIIPNPASTEIHLRTELPVKQWFIFDLHGRQLITSKTSLIAVDELAAGTYIVKAEGYVGRFVKI